jgi:hypothetical protein
MEGDPMTADGARTGLTVADLLVKSQELGRDRFLARYVAPYLIQLGVLSSMRDESTGFKTLEDNPSDDTPTDMRVTPDARVWVVHKTQLTFPDKISIGRSRNNDITISDPNVSKLHAYLTPSGDSHVLVDADSSNGSFVDNRRITALEPKPVDDGQVLQFGPTARMMLCTPSSLWTILSAGLVR